MINEIRKVLSLIKDVEKYRYETLKNKDINNLITKITEMINMGYYNFISEFRCGIIIFCRDANDIYFHIEHIRKALYSIRRKQPNRCETVDEYMPRHKAVKYMIKELDALISTVKCLCNKCGLNYDELKEEASL